MSDIYLQITETPTVVTLSAPVISGALTSTVTVANTVTVALDSNSLSALENVTVTVGAAITGTVTVSNFPASQAVTFSAVSISNFPAAQPVSIASVTVGNTVTIAGTVTVGNSLTISSLPAISGTVTANVTTNSLVNGLIDFAASETAIPVYLNFSLPPGTANIGTVTVGNTVTIAGTVTANPTGTQTIAGTVTAETNLFSRSNPFLQDTVLNIRPVAGYVATTTGSSTYAPIKVSSDGTLSIAGTVTANLNSALVAGTAQIGSVTASISNSVTIGSIPAISGTVTANTFALQGTAVTTSNFTSTTASTVLAGFNATREVLTIFNEGAGNLHICAGATCTTIAYQVRLSAGDYYEVPNHQTTITHSAVFATAGTARIVQIS